MHAVKYLSKRTAIALLGAGAVALVACSSSPSGREGNLGHGIFGYQCADPSDPACPDGATTLMGCDGAAATTSSARLCFPSAVAEGSHFRVRYSSALPENVGNPTVAPVSTVYLTAGGDGLFQAIKPGYAGIVAQSTVRIEVIDYTLVKIARIGSLVIRDDTGRSAPPSLSLPKAARATYKLASMGAAGEPLAGALDYTWSSSNLTVVRLVQGNPAASMTIEALAPGTATLTATSGSHKASLDITVSP